MKARLAMIVPLVATMFTGVTAKDRISVIEDAITFNVDRFDDGRSLPYRVVFWENGRNIFYFDTAGFVKTIKIGSEKYNIRYNSSGHPKRVVLKSQGRRNLGEEEDQDVEEVEGPYGGGEFDHDSRRLYTCDECEATWDAVCDEGVPSVCSLASFGSSLSADASASVAVFCATFGDACSSSGGSETCAGQCEENDEDDDDEEEQGLNPCLDPTSDEYKCSFTGLVRMRLDNCGLVDSDAYDLPACFESFGKTNLKRLYLSYNVNPTINVMTTLPEDVFSGLTELTTLELGHLGLTSLPAGLFSGLTSLTILALYYNDLTTLPGGIFSGLVNVKYMYLYENSLVTLPDGGFSDCSRLEILNLDVNKLATLPAGAFSGMTRLQDLLLDNNELVALPQALFSGLPELFRVSMENNRLTTLPEGLFTGIENAYALILSGNSGLQCVPDSSAERYSWEDNDFLEDIATNGVCGCTPEAAVMCDSGTSCEPGGNGYTCVAE